MAPVRPPTSLSKEDPMVELSQLWLPIVASGIVVFFLSFLMWMVAPHHRTDWSAAPDEDKLMDTLREMGAKGGQYAFPHCTGAEQMKDPVWKEKYTKGPKGFLTLKPEGPENMGKMLATSGGLNLVGALFTAYVASLALAPGEDGMAVFRLTATVAFMGCSLGLLWGPVWFGRSWSSALKEVFDGLVYGVATGLVFMLLWPGVPG